MNLEKYYSQRYLIFKKYDEGICMDDECWYSVTPENISSHVAKYIKTKLHSLKQIKVLELFSGGGGDNIQCSLEGMKVTTVDIDPTKIAIVKHNNKIYNVKPKVILGDAFNLNSKYYKEKYDVLMASPPWGGIGYTSKSETKLSEFCPEFYKSWIYFINNISPNTAVWLPKNISISEIVQTIKVPVKVRKYFTYGKLKMICVFTGNLI